MARGRGGGGGEVGRQVHIAHATILLSEVQYVMSERV